MKTLMNSRFYGTLKVPGDKSITHRSLMFASLAKGTSHVKDPLLSEDTYATKACMESLGVEIVTEAEGWRVDSPGRKHLHSPSAPLYAGNSGTTARLLTGMIAGIGLEAEIVGDASISKRPMDRIKEPLEQMGARIALKNDKYPPIEISKAGLSPISYTMPVASAQVKSALLLAGLFVEGKSVITEPSPSRNHSELMLEEFGADISVDDQVITLDGGKELSPADVVVPGDISSAAFLLVLAILKPGSDITIENVSLNETRSGIIDVLEMMEADITVEPTSMTGEPIGNIRAIYTPKLKGFEISGALIPRLIDEIPILTLLAAHSDGPCTVRDAVELRYKETDRIRAVIDELSKFGFEFTEYNDGFTVSLEKIHLAEGVSMRGYDDHRIIMMLIVLGIVMDQPLDIDDMTAIDISYPDFMADLEALRKDA